MSAKTKNQVQVFFLTFLLFTSGSFFSQSAFHKLYGDTTTEAVFGLCNSSYDGGYVFTGRSIKSITQLMAVKINAAGDTLWTRFISNTNSQGASVLQTPDSGYVFLGSYTSGANTDVLLLKLNKNGNFVWAKTFDFNGNSDIAKYFVQATDGGFYITGYTAGTQNDIFVIRTNKNGVLKWNRIYQSAYSRRGEGITLTSDGNFVVAGDTQDSITNTTNFLVFKADTATGNPVWTKTHHGSSPNSFSSVHENSINEIVVGGTSQEYAVGVRSAFLCVFDLNGNYSFSNSYGHCGTVVSNRMIIAPGDYYVFTGFAQPFCFGLALVSYIYYVDVTGTLIWNKSYGTLAKPMVGYDLKYSSNGFAVAADYSQNGQNDDVSIVKTDLTGNTSCGVNTLSVTILYPSPTFSNTAFTPTTGFTSQVVTPTFVKGIQTPTLCITTGLNKFSLAEKSTVYPNPFNDKLIIEHQTQIKNVSVCDLMGRKIPVEMITSKGETELSTSQQTAPGIYILRINFIDGTSYQQKLIKN